MTYATRMLGVLVLASTALAQSTPQKPAENPAEAVKAIPAPESPVSLKAPSIDTGFEAPAWSTGSCVQNGWTRFSAGSGETVLAGTGMGGAQHVRFDSDSGVGTGSSLGCFSPEVNTAGEAITRTTVDVNVSAQGGADYYVFAQNPSTSSSVGAVNFDWQGDIDVFDYSVSGYVDSGLTWTGGTTYNITIEVEVGTAAKAPGVRYYVDGNLVFTSVLNPNSLNDGITQVVLYHDNWQDTDIGDMDNFTCCSVPAVLPVELTAFDAVVQGTDALLTWATASETDNAGFAVERLALDVAGGVVAGSEWIEVAFVEGAGTVETPQSYAFRVADLTAGTHQFRLKQVDFDGAFEYSEIVEVTVVPEQGVFLAAYPNPVAGQGRVRLVQEDEVPVRVDVYDLLGRHVRTLHSGATREVDALLPSDLPSGVYLIQAEAGSVRETIRVSVIR
ncbi:MAG: T9SS type A sorting domain-containing protein [Bacteroidota bacterium]